MLYKNSPFLILTLNLLWSERDETNERRFDLLLQILITQTMDLCTMYSMYLFVVPVERVEGVHSEHDEATGAERWIQQ